MISQRRKVVTIYDIIFNDRENMKVLQDMVFLSEIVMQSKIALRAAERLQSGNNELDKIDVWSCIQSILVAAGNVSKILWPAKSYEERGKRLRQILRVEENNPLCDRKFRNHFVHYDDRIEDWFKKYPSAGYTDLAMNPSLPGNHVYNIHRGYNSFNNTLVFRNEILDMNLILKALEDILKNCKPYVLS